MPDLVVKNLGLRLGGNDILTDVSLSVRAGEAVALLGPSGSGKTSLLRAIAGLERPHTGSITIGETVFFDAGSGIDLPPEKRGLGLVFQSYALWPHRTVFDNVAAGLRVRRMKSGEVKSRVEKVLADIGLADFAHRYPRELSGGQQQRVAIARALVYQPPVILLDEPLSNLDAKLRDEARAWLRALIVDLGLSAICVTHDQTEAMTIADRITLLNGGMVEQEGTPAELYSDPLTLFAAEFLGGNNRLDGVLVENTPTRAVIEVAGHRLTGMAKSASTAGGKAAAIIRIGRIRVTPGPGPNRLPMQMQAPMFVGERWELLFKNGPLSVRAYAGTPPKPGEHFLEFPPEALWVF